jgi:hypothetical protein
LSFQNRTDGTGAFAQILVGTSSNSTFIQQFSSSYTTSNSKVAGSGRLHGQGLLAILGQSGVAVWTGNDESETRRADFTNTGNLLIGTTTDITGTGGLHVAGTSTASTTTSGALRVGSNIGLSGNAGGASYFGGSVVSNNASQPLFSAAISGTSIGSFSAFGADVYIGVDQNANGNMIFRRNSATESMRITGSNGAVNITSTVSASTATTGALTIGNGSAATNVAIGGGNVNAGGTGTFGGAVSLSTAGTTVSIKSGTNAAAGTVTLVGGAGTITSTAIDVNTVIVMSIKTKVGSFDHAPSVVVAAGSATIDGHNSDDSTYNWVALKVN